jgi:Fe(3+) dicitrate transport protein
LMKWLRSQAQVRYRLASDDVTVDVVGYRHDLDRHWNKVNGVRGGAALHDVLTYEDAGAFPLAIAALKGNADVDGEAILIGPNQRRYVSQGVSATARARLLWGPEPWTVEQNVEAGVRLHHDGLSRVHSERGFSVREGAVIDSGEEDVFTADNEASAVALAGYVADDIRFLDLVLVPGMRVEVIHGRFTDKLTNNETVESNQLALMPGIGLAWQPLPTVVLLAGVHRGFSPIAPGQRSDLKPEDSINTEAGLRVDFKRALGLSAELVGFYSYYQNILGECTYSSGCGNDIGVQQNGGVAAIGGAELAVRHQLPIGDRAVIKTEFSYTFTRALFLSTFTSSNPLFARVSAGDEMPYVPPHQLAWSGAWVAGGFDIGVSAALISRMRDIPGQHVPIAYLPGGQQEERANSFTDSQAIADLSTSYEVWPGVRLAVRGDNVFDQRAIVSRRPFGARPGKPRSILLSIEMTMP